MTQLLKFIRSSRIRVLSINYCALGDVGGMIVAEAIQDSRNMKELYARKNEFRDKTAKVFAHSFENNNSDIEKVDLAGNLINDSGGELIGLSLSSNSTLQHLDLRKNNLRATSGVMFVQSLKDNKTLKSLKLQNNSINISFLE